MEEPIEGAGVWHYRPRTTSRTCVLCASLSDPLMLSSQASCARICVTDNACISHWWIFWRILLKIHISCLWCIHIALYVEQLYTYMVAYIWLHIYKTSFEYEVMSLSQGVPKICPFQWLQASFIKICLQLNANVHQRQCQQSGRRIRQAGFCTIHMSHMTTSQGRKEESSTYASSELVHSFLLSLYYRL